MKGLAHYGALAAFTFAFAFNAHAQNARVIHVVPDGQEVSITLTPEDNGRDIILLAESTKKTAQTVTVTLGGVPGIIGQVYSTALPANTAMAQTDPYTGWSRVDIRYPQSDFRPQIQVGESTTSSGTSGSGSCFAELNPISLQLLLLLYPGKSEAEICAILYGGGEQPPPEEQTGDLTPARGAILRDACSSAYKMGAQFRIITAGQPAETFDGTKVIRASLKLNPAKILDSARLKAAEGRERGDWLYLSPSINPVYQDKYNVPGSDRLIIQRYSAKGVLKSSKSEPTRPLFGSVIYSLSRVGKHLRGGKLTFTSKNGERVHSRCINPATRKSRCWGKYSKLHGIRCSSR